MLTPSSLVHSILKGSAAGAELSPSRLTMGSGDETETVSEEMSKELSITAIEPEG
jgi:hypothetical protein